MASNLVVMASNLVEMTSALRVMASNLLAMASSLVRPLANRTICCWDHDFRTSFCFFPALVAMVSTLRCFVQKERHIANISEDCHSPKDALPVSSSNAKDGTQNMKAKNVTGDRNPWVFEPSCQRDLLTVNDF